MDKHLLSKEEVLLQSLYDFYDKDQDIINKILPIITGKSELSLRILDYFVTNYSKSNNIKIKNENSLQSCVYQDYKNKLKSYNKRFFDPFCRINKKNMTNRIPFKYSDDKVIITTIGQLNFFRWAIRNNIIDYVMDNHEDINNEMIKFTNNKKLNKLNKKRAVKENNVKIINTTIDFGHDKTYKIKTTQLIDKRYDIAKLEFEN